MSGDFHCLGNYLKEQRNAYGFTQAELAKKLKVHVQFVSNWGRGICAPPSHCFHQLIETLGLDREHVVEVMLSDAKNMIEFKVFRILKKSGLVF